MWIAGVTDKDISIHASAREATFTVNIACKSNLFQSTPPRRRRLSDLSVRREYRDFNPRLREGGDRRSKKKAIPQQRFQSTPPRGRRRFSSHNQTEQSIISIHASAREATNMWIAGVTDKDISIHASAREATREALESDDVFWISIHASAREATAIFCMTSSLPSFQSTPPRGRRRTRKTLPDHLSHFNPRLREGGDKKAGDKVTANALFQSTPPRGRRHFCLRPGTS